MSKRFPPKRPSQDNATLEHPVERRAPDNGARQAIGASAGGRTAEFVQATVDRIARRWRGAPPIAVIPTQLDIPERHRSEGHAGRVEGYFAEGRVVLVADALASEADIVRVLLHETVGHAGLRGAFGSRLGAILDLIQVARPADIARKIREYRLTNDAAGRRLAAEEILAELAESQQPNLGFVKVTVGAFRALLRRLGVCLRWTDSDIVIRIIEPARRFVERGRPSRDAVDPARAYSVHSEFAADALAELAAHDELFRHPISQSKDLATVMRDIDPAVVYVGDETRLDEKGESGAEQRLMFRSATGKNFYVFTRGADTWMDVSRVDEGSGGSAVYAAVANWARNTGRTFVGDPAGLSPEALRRRTDAMLSSALKFGTTRHLEPHEYQLQGDANRGVPALKWRSGDDYGNVQSLIETSVASTLAAVPEIAHVRYDFSRREFVDADSGKPIGPGAFARWTELPGSRAANAGRRSLARVALLNTLLRASGATRPGLLAGILQLENQRLGSLRGIFYSLAPAEGVRRKGR